MGFFARRVKPPLPDPTLDPFRGGVGVLTHGGVGVLTHGGVGVLTHGGVVAGHLASTVGNFWSPFSPTRLQWWVWFVVVWTDGEREPSTEDSPLWSYVDEMKRGFLAWEGSDRARDRRYEFRCLPPAEADDAKQRLAIGPEDF